MLGLPLMDVLKRDGTRQPFSFRKIAASIDSACGGPRPPCYAALIDELDGVVPRLAKVKDRGRGSEREAISTHSIQASIVFALRYTHRLADVAARYAAHDSILGPDGFRALLGELRSCAAVPGPTAELGVFRGHTARAILDARGASLHYCYDTFGGICGAHEADSDGHLDGEFACSLADVRRYVSSDRAVYKVGRFPEAFAEGALRFAFVYIDLATHSGTRAALARFADAMAPGGKMVVYIGSVSDPPNHGKNGVFSDKNIAGTIRAAVQFGEDPGRNRQFSAKLAPPFFIFQNLGRDPGASADGELQLVWSSSLSEVEDVRRGSLP